MMNSPQYTPWSSNALCGSCGSSLVSLEVFPQHKSCWSCGQLLYVTLFFISPLFPCLFNLEFQNLLLSVPSVPSCSFLLSIFSIQLFSTLLSIPCSVFSLYLFALFSDLPYCFLFKSVILSFSLLLLCSVCFSLKLYSYSICSLSISRHTFRSLYLILLCYLFCSCFCFLYISSFW